MTSAVTLTAQFFEKRGYNVTSPKIIRGKSGFDQNFDLSATKGKEEIVLDISSGPAPVSPGVVVGFFAKIFDTRPQRPMLVCIPGVDHDAQSLITMYKIEAVVAIDIENALEKFASILQPRPPT